MHEFLESLSTKDLFFILESPNLNSLVTYFDERRKPIKAYIPKPGRVLQRTRGNIKSRALELSLDDTSASLDAYWNLVSLVSLGLAALPVTIGVLCLTGMWGSYNFYSSFQKIKKHREDNIQFFQLLEFKLAAADIIIERKHRQINNPSLCRVPEAKRNFIQPPVSLPSLKPALYSGAKVTFFLFAAYYLATAWIFEAIAMASILAAMTNPVGLAIAGTIAISIGIYCAYQYYQAEKASKFIKNEKNNILNKLNEKHDECFRLKGIQQSIGFFARAQWKTEQNELFCEPRRSQLSLSN